MVSELGETSAGRLKDLGYANVECRIGNGYAGWPEHAPYNGIIVTAAATHIPQPLIDQLAVGGRLVIPVGQFDQELLLITRRKNGTIKRETKLPVRFVPMTGEAEDD